MCNGIFRLEEYVEKHPNDRLSAIDWNTTPSSSTLVLGRDSPYATATSVQHHANYIQNIPNYFLHTYIMCILCS